MHKHFNPNANESVQRYVRDTLTSKWTLRSSPDALMLQIPWYLQILGISWYLGALLGFYCENEEHDT